MARTPRDHQDGPSLPDLSGQGQGQSPLPDFTRRPTESAVYTQATEHARHRSRTVILAVVIPLVVILAVVALVLSQTVFKGALADDAHEDPTVAQTREHHGESEYVPDPSDPDIAPPPPIFTEKPSTSCYMPENVQPAPPSSGTTVRGGALSYQRPPEWDYPWTGQGDLPYMNQVGAYAHNVEGNWYSVVNIGSVDWPDGVDGGYPGTEDAAVAIFQCYATTGGVLEGFGEHPTITDYRSEATDVDGHEAWIVQATYHFEDPDYLSTTKASIVTSIVVETDDGPQALASDVAADVPEDAKAIDDIVDSLAVVS
jgi:hypothetical protein